MPAATAQKPAFGAVPAEILSKIAGICGAPVISGDIAAGGLSASAGFILALADGRRVFAKGNHPDEMAHGTANLRQEIHVYQGVPALRDVSPPYIGLVSDGDEDGWMLGLWEVVDAGGSPDIGAMMTTLLSFQQAPLPAGVLPEAAAHNYLKFFMGPEKKWRRLAEEPKVRGKFTALFEDPAQAEDWLQRNLPALLALQEGDLPQMPQGLLHGDLRCDNFIFGAARADVAATYIVDWPNACRGPRIFDVLFLASNLGGLGLYPAEKFLEEYLARSLQQHDAAAVNGVLARMAGYFADQVYRAVPEKMPQLRWMQKCMFLAQIQLLACRGVIESPPAMLESTAGSISR